VINHLTNYFSLLSPLNDLKMGQMDLLRFLEKYYGWWSTYHIRLKLGWSNGRINANLNRLLKRGCVERDSAFMEINGSIRKGVIWRYKKC